MITIRPSYSSFLRQSVSFIYGAVHPDAFSVGSLQKDVLGLPVKYIKPSSAFSVSEREIPE